MGSREGHMPEVLSMVQLKKMTPAPAVIFMVSLSLVGNRNLFLHEKLIIDICNGHELYVWLTFKTTVRNDITVSIDI